MKQMMKRVVAILVSLTLIAGVCPAETQAAASEISTVSTASGTLEDNEENTVEAAGMTAEATGTNSIGTLLANTINEQQSMNTVSTSSSSETDEDDTDTEEAEDHIAELTVEGATATVSYATSVTADVVVAIYDESTEQMTASGSAEVETNTNSVEITLEGTMPTYFVATAYLMDAESHAPLSAEYSTNLYTQDMQEFLAKETTDFDENLVVNLDDSTDNNFMVFDEETTLAKESDTVNLITDNGDDTYTITNADETFTGLAVGDVVSYTYDDGTMLILVVKEITVDGTTVTITDDPDADISDVFSYVKIDTTKTETASESEEGLSTAAVDGTSDEIELANIDLADLLSGQDIDSVNGTVSLTIDPDLKFYYGENFYYHFEFTADTTLTFNLSIEGKLRKAIPIVPTQVGWSPCPGVYVGFTPSVVFQIESKLKAEGTLKGILGQSHDSKEGKKDLSTGMTFDNLNVDGEVAGFIGVSLEPKIGLLCDEFIEASVDIECGVEIKATLSTATTEVKVGVQHDCVTCVDGDVNLKAKISLKLTILSLWKPKWTISDTRKLCDFYYSVDHKEFGIGACPYLRYKIELTVLGSDEKPVEGAAILGTELYEEAPVTDENGQAVIYLCNGTYNLSARASNAGQNKQIKVKDAPKKVTVMLGVSAKKATAGTCGGVYLASGTCGENLAWTLDKDGLLTISGTGAMQDYLICENGHNKQKRLGYAPWDSYRNLISSVLIMDGVTSVGGDAFSDCGNLTSVTIPGSVTSISCYAFYGCTSLPSVTLPDSITSIGCKAFQNCTGLTRITIPSSVTSVEAYTFYGCTSLTSIVIGNGVTSIGDDAFSCCTSLTNITIPASVKQIDDTAFISSVTDFVVESGNDTYSAVDGILLSKDETVLECYPNKRSGSSYVIPDSVTSIDDFAFMHARLTSVTISDNVTSIGSCAFHNCDLLTSIAISDSVTSIGDGAFECAYRLSNVYYYGTEEEWSAITIGSCNTYLTSATIHYNSTGSETAETTSDNTQAEMSETADEPGEISELETDSIDESETATDESTEPETTMNESTKESEEPTEVNPIDEFSLDADSSARAQNLSLNKTSSVGQVSLLRVSLATTSVADTLEVDAGNARLETLSTDTGDSTSATKTAVFNNLVAGESYVLLVVKSLDEDALLTTDNLLYIAQGTADESGALSFQFVPREDAEGMLAYAFGKSSKDLKDAEITVEELTYNGEAQIPLVTVQYDGVTLDEDVDYTLSGDLSAIDVGEYSITVTGKICYSGSQTVTYQCAEAEKETETETEPETKAKAAAPTFSFKSASLTKTYGDKAFTNAVTTNSDGAVTYTSSNTKVATVTGAGSVTIVGAGTAVITATAAETANYKAVSASYTLTVNQASPTLKFKSSSLTKAMGGNAFTNKLTVKTDGKLTYKSSNTKVAKVNQKGKVTIKGVGKATITVTAAAGTNYKAGKAKYTVKVNPSKVTIKKVANVKGKKIKITWKKNTTGTGYEIQYSTDKKFKKSVKKKKVTKNKTTSATYSKLTKNKKYYVRIRSYKKVSGKTYYSAWSSVKKVTVKK